MDLLLNWMMVFLRAGAFLAVFPVFSSQSFPVLMRVALGAAMAFLIGPLLPAAAWPADLLGMIGWMLMEIGAGLLLGFASRLIFFALEIAGAIVTTEIGLALSPSVNPLSEIQSTAPSTILFYLAAMLWLTLDLHHWLLFAFQRSYHYLPVGQARLPENLALDLVQSTSHLFLLAAQMAAPVMAVSFLVTLIFALLSRAVPQMNVFSESFGFRLLAGLLTFGVSLQLIAQYAANYLRHLPQDLLRVAQLLGPLS